MIHNVARPKPFLFPVARMAPLALQAMFDYDITADEAVSMVVSHGKACKMAFGVDGWPHNCIVYSEGASLRDLVEFVFGFGFRLVWDIKTRTGIVKRSTV